MSNLWEDTLKLCKYLICQWTFGFSIQQWYLSVSIFTMIFVKWWFSKSVILSTFIIFLLLIFWYQYSLFSQSVIIHYGYYLVLMLKLFWISQWKSHQTGSYVILLPPFFLVLSGRCSRLISYFPWISPRRPDSF